MREIIKIFRPIPFPAKFSDYIRFTEFLNISFYFSWYTGCFIIYMLLVNIHIFYGI